MHGAMLGAMDSVTERESEEEAPLPTLQQCRLLFKAPASKVPFGEAIQKFEERQIVSREVFDQLSAAAKQRAFTIAGLATEELLGDAHAELARQLKASDENSYFNESTGKWVYKGPNIREFDKFAKERLETAGWTPANPSHVETIFRTNVASAYSGGRVAEMTQPDVLAARPYWQIVAVGDSRSRPAHKRAHNTILAADNPFWRTVFPPFGYNCRCRVVSRSKRWVDAHGGPTRVPVGLPDPGFTCGTNTLISSGIQHQQQSDNAPLPSQYPARPLDSGLPAPFPGVSPVAPTLPTAPVAPPPVYKPLPAPPPRPTKLTAADVMQQQLAGPGGSNEGGVYLGADGKKRYVKLYTDASQAPGENLANRIYADLGLGKVKSVVFEHSGRLSYASEMLDDIETLGKAGLTKELASQALDGFVGDLITGNWDAVGMTLDNMVVKNGKLLRIDNGGTFLMRAKAGRKNPALLTQLTEWDAFFNPNINPAYSKLAQAAGIDSAADMLPRIKQQLKALEQLASDAGGWSKYVSKHAEQLTAEDAQAIVNMLEMRTKLIGDKIIETEAKVAAAKKAAALAEKKATEAAKKAEAAAKKAAEEKALAEAAAVAAKKAAFEKAKQVAAGKAAKEAAAKAAEATKQAELAKSKATKRVLEELPFQSIPKLPKHYPMLDPKYPGEDNFRYDSIVREASRKRLMATTTEEQRVSIGKFTGSDYEDIRAAMRLTREEYNHRSRDISYDIARMHGERISQAMRDAKTMTGSGVVDSEVTEMFRGVRNLSKDTFEKLINAKTVTWNEPTSTSWHPERSLAFYRNYTNSYSVMYRIRPSASTSGVSIEGVSSVAPEHEILFGNGVKFKVVNVARDEGFERGAIIYVEELPP